MIKTFIMLQTMLFFWTFYSSKKNLLSSFQQNNNNNNKCFFEEQIRILEWFLKDHVTGVMMLKISFERQQEERKKKLEIHLRVQLNSLLGIIKAVPNKLFNCTRKWISSYFVW